MQKILMIGATLLLSLSACKPPTIKNPVKMYAISQSFDEAGAGYKNLNIRSKKKYVGEWVTEVEFIPLQDAPNDMMCFSMKNWLTAIKPKLKEGAEYYHDRK